MANEFGLLSESSVERVFFTKFVQQNKSKVIFTQNPTLNEEPGVYINASFSQKDTLCINVYIPINNGGFHTFKKRFNVRIVDSEQVFITEGNPNAFSSIWFAIKHFVLITKSTHQDKFTASSYHFLDSIVNGLDGLINQSVPHYFAIKEELNKLKKNLAYFNIEIPSNGELVERYDELWELVEKSHCKKMERESEERRIMIEALERMVKKKCSTETTQPE